MNWKALGTNILMYGRKQLPSILTGGAIIGVWTTAYTAWKTAPKAQDVISAAKEELKRSDISEEEARALKIDTAKEVAKIIWPVVASGALTTACALGSHSVSVKRQAAITAAYTLSETALKEYQDKAIEIFGKKKAESVKDAINTEKIEKNPASKNYIVMTGNGDYLCYDAYSGRYFRSSIEKVRKAINDLNQNMTMGSVPYCSVNEFYDEIGLPQITMGEDSGWSAANLIELHETYAADDLGEPCMVVDFLVKPTPFFRDLY